MYELPLVCGLICRTCWMSLVPTVLMSLTFLPTYSVLYVQSSHFLLAFHPDSSFKWDMRACVQLGSVRCVSLRNIYSHDKKT